MLLHVQSWTRAHKVKIEETRISSSKGTLIIVSIVFFTRLVVVYFLVNLLWL